MEPISSFLLYFLIAIAIVRLRERGQQLALGEQLVEEKTPDYEQERVRRTRNRACSICERNLPVISKQAKHNAVEFMVASEDEGVAAEIFLSFYSDHPDFAELANIAQAPKLPTIRFQLAADNNSSSLRDHLRLANPVA